MQTFAQERGAAWAWRRRSFWNHDADLFAGDRAIASLETTGHWLSPRLGRTANGAWRIRYEGLLARDLVVRDAATDAVVARYRAGWWGQGTVTFERGRTWQWRRVGFWGRRHEWVDGGGLTCVSFARGRGLTGRTTDVQVGAHMANDPALEPLVLLGYDLLLRLAHQSAAIAAS
jgi:hypothetical protein